MGFAIAAPNPHVFSVRIVRQRPTGVTSSPVLALSQANIALPVWDALRRPECGSVVEQVGEQWSLVENEEGKDKNSVSKYMTDKSDRVLAEC